MNRHVLIYAKPPLIGLAKTRLAASLDRSTAKRIAQMTMRRTLQQARDPRWRTVLYAAPDRWLSHHFGGLWPTDLPRASQGAGDLGDRLTRGLRATPPGPIVFIGSDAPDLTRRLIWQAFAQLKRHDAVFGPASDGGFWLFGLSGAHRRPRPFNGVRWSGPHALADVRDRLPRGSRISYLPTLIDIDEAADWQAWRQQRT